MSLASDFAALCTTTNAAEPPSWTGPGGLMRSEVDPNGNCLIIVEGRHFPPVPGAVMLNLAAWITATFA